MRVLLEFEEWGNEEAYTECFIVETEYVKKYIQEAVDNIRIAHIREHGRYASISCENVIQKLESQGIITTHTHYTHYKIQVHDFWDLFRHSHTFTVDTNVKIVSPPVEKKDIYGIL